ncbi:unnamed protein product [Colias eurytheme]|nr:unnamed protein product [Colias eurytheme]
MSKFLSTFVQNISINLHTNRLFTAMSKRNIYRKVPRIRPEVKVVSSRSNQSGAMQIKEKVEVLAEPIKSVSDKKLYKTIRLENGLTALLISDPSKITTADEGSSTEEESSGSEETGSESDGAQSVQSTTSDQLSTKRRGEFDEEKLMWSNYGCLILQFLCHYHALLVIKTNLHSDLVTK